SFGELFKAAGHDFYKLDPMLFAPARAVVGNLRSGRSFSAGAVDRERLLGFWLGQA
ncbi:MAG: methenyltetrahydromethanopterin cyclohydrolase, partial [Rhodocyclaceae bacterium]|nr:methenyltetrahydromethanopterin cyclohydrolase [Rhodocyclaceae bacterium]